MGRGQGGRVPGVSQAASVAWEPRPGCVRWVVCLLGGGRPRVGGRVLFGRSVVIAAPRLVLRSDPSCRMPIMLSASSAPERYVSMISSPRMRVWAPLWRSSESLSYTRKAPASSFMIPTTWVREVTTATLKSDIWAAVTAPSLHRFTTSPCSNKGARMTGQSGNLMSRGVSWCNWCWASRATE